MNQSIFKKKKKKKNLEASFSFIFPSKSISRKKKKKKIFHLEEKAINSRFLITNPVSIKETK